jgi:hypothetical protein
MGRCRFGLKNDRFMMSAVFSFDTKYVKYSQAYQGIVSFCNIINLNVDYVSPSCILPGREWRHVRVSSYAVLYGYSLLRYCRGTT